MARFEFTSAGASEFNVPVGILSITVETQLNGETFTDQFYPLGGLTGSTTSAFIVSDDEDIAGASTADTLEILFGPDATALD